jgi:hypothetical protein
MKSNVGLRVIVAVFVMAAFVVAGCASSSQMKMTRESVDPQQERAMVQRSLERFDEGNFYVYTWSIGGGGTTAAVVADFKDDDKVIKPGSGWRKVTSPQDLEQCYKSGSHVKARAGMRLYRIEGADGELWGYFFAPQNILPYRVLDANTIELGTIPEPKAPGA